MDREGEKATMRFLALALCLGMASFAPHARAEFGEIIVLEGATLACPFIDDQREVTSLLLAKKGDEAIADMKSLVASRRCEILDGGKKVMVTDDRMPEVVIGIRDLETGDRYYASAMQLFGTQGTIDRLNKLKAAEKK